MATIDEIFELSKKVQALEAKKVCCLSDLKSISEIKEISSQIIQHLIIVSKLIVCLKCDDSKIEMVSSKMKDSGNIFYIIAILVILLKLAKFTIE